MCKITDLLAMAPNWPELSKRRQTDLFCQGEEQKYLVTWLQCEKLNNSGRNEVLFRGHAQEECLLLIQGAVAL